MAGSPLPQKAEAGMSPAARERLAGKILGKDMALCPAAFRRPAPSLPLFFYCLKNLLRRHPAQRFAVRRLRDRLSWQSRTIGFEEGAAVLAYACAENKPAARKRADP